MRTGIHLHLVAEVQSEPRPGGKFLRQRETFRDEHPVLRREIIAVTESLLLFTCRRRHYLRTVVLLRLLPPFPRRPQKLLVEAMIVEAVFTMAIRQLPQMLAAVPLGVLHNKLKRRTPPRRSRPWGERRKTHATALLAKQHRCRIFASLRRTRRGPCCMIGRLPTVLIRRPLVTLYPPARAQASAALSLMIPPSPLVLAAPLTCHLRLRLPAAA